MRILIAIPTKGQIEVETFASVANLDWCGHEIEYGHADGRGVYGIAQARNRIAEKAIDGDFDKVLMIDSDTIVPEDALKHLLDPDVPIVIGVERYKNDSGLCPIFKHTLENGTDAWEWDKIPSGRFDIKSGGCGCCLIDVDVFKRIKKPYFRWVDCENGTHQGEDIYFYEKAMAAGYKIEADGRVRCKHIGRKIYD